MTIEAVYEGNDPDASIGTANAWLGQDFGAVTVFTGQANWSDYESSIGWAAYEAWGAAKTNLWSIPLFANGGNLATAATGAYDSYYTQAAQQLITSTASSTSPIYVRTGWEFNGNWETWSAQTDPADYVKAFQQFVDSYRSVSNRFVFTWSPGIGANGMSDVAAAYPGDAYVDIIGADVYDAAQYQGTDPNAAFNTMLTEQFGLNWLSSFAAAHGKPLALPEWGVDADNDGAFITDVANWIKANNVAYQSYWDSDNSFNGQLSTGAMPDASAAFLAAFGPQATAAAAAPAAVSLAVATPAVATPAVATPAVATPAAATPAATPAAPAALTAAALHTAAMHSTDFDGDGKSDILFVNTTTNQVGAWETTRGFGTAHYADLGSVGAGWQVQGLGDFDGDGKGDVLWRNSTTGDVALWESTKGLGTAHYVDLGVVDNAYQIAGVGDFDGDGKTDVLWHNATTGDYGLWESTKGLNTANYVDLGTTGAGWSVQGIGDFDGDGKADVLWRNTNGDVALWQSTKGLGTAHYTDLGIVSTDWQIQGVGDFDGDGKADVLWRNTTTGDVALWESSKGLGTANYVDLGVVSNSWQIVGTGDYDGDKKTDILWHNATTGDYGVWESTQGLSSAHFVDLGTVTAGWQIATTHYDGA